MKVLLVETDLGFQNEILVACSYEPRLEVTVAHSVTQAAIILLQNPIDLVIVDYQLSLQDDQYLVNFCQSATPHIPILYTLTESDLNTQTSQTFDVHFSDYVVKPFITQDLLFRLRKLCNLSIPEVLLITPHSDLAQQVQWALSTQGVLLWTIPNRDSLPTVLQQHSLRLIIWDLISDSTSSSHIAQTLRSHAPVLALAPLSGLSPDQTLALSLVQDYINLPFIPQDLGARVKRLFTFRSPVTVTSESDHIEHQTEIDRLKVALHHEIRNPLTSIMIGAQALAHQFQDGTAEKNVLSTIENSSQRIKSVMDALSNAKAPYSVETYVDGVQMLKLPW